VPRHRLLRGNLAEVLCELGDFSAAASLAQEAQSAIEEALEIADTDDNDVWRAHWLAELARIQLAQDRPGQAETAEPAETPEPVRLAGERACERTTVIETARPAGGIGGRCREQSEPRTGRLAPAGERALRRRTRER
jgi:hypothetical protein